MTNDPPSAAAAAPRPRRKRSSVTADEILIAAEQLSPAGFDAITMRAVAERMGASPMSLYRYFATKDDLVDAMLDRVLGRVELAATTDDWLADLRAYVVAHRAVLAQHPWAIVPLFTHSNPGINATILGEAAFGILARGGVTGVRAVATFSGILALNYGWSAFSIARDATRDSADPEAELGAALAMLPAERFPHTLAVADELSRYGTSEQYAIALDQVLAGVASWRT